MCTVLVGLVLQVGAQRPSHSLSPGVLKGTPLCQMPPTLHLHSPRSIDCTTLDSHSRPASHECRDSFCGILSRDSASAAVRRRQPSKAPRQMDLQQELLEAVRITSSGIAKGRELAEARLVVGVMAGLYRAGPLR